MKIQFYLFVHKKNAHKSGIIEAKFAIVGDL